MTLQRVQTKIRSSIFILARVMAGLVIGMSTSPLQAKSGKSPSTCVAIAQSLPGVTYASLTPAALANHEVRITYKGHSTYLIESASGVSVATDFTGLAQPAAPTVVTMNHAHDTHYTDYPDQQIKHILRGWSIEGSVAKHHLSVGDVLVRNVTTDIMMGNLRIADDNSIFIVEVAGLCIGHLGHLHHELSDEHYRKIGRLDVVMVPIDGAMTLSLGGMTKIVKRLRSSVILPMHARGWATPADFISLLGDDFDHQYLEGRSLVLSLFDMPKRPKVMVPSGM